MVAHHNHMHILYQALINGQILKELENGACFNGKFVMWKTRWCMFDNVVVKNTVWWNETSLLNLLQCISCMVCVF